MKNQIKQLRYGKRYPNMPYQKRHCKVLVIARGRPRNVLVRLRGGVLMVVPFGNLKDKYYAEK